MFGQVTCFAMAQKKFQVNPCKIDLVMTFLLPLTSVLFGQVMCFAMVKILVTSPPPPCVQTRGAVSPPSHPTSPPSHHHHPLVQTRGGHVTTHSPSPLPSCAGVTRLSRAQTRDGVYFYIYLSSKIEVFINI
jgi:hypothetical protein